MELIRPCLQLATGTPVSSCRQALILHWALFIIVSLQAINCLSQESEPLSFGAVPTERQIAWHRVELIAFLHFSINTFTDKEWGYGDERPEIFNPAEFDADQIICTLAETGFRGVILTAKHHDGFCIWPSDYTAHSVKNSPWKNGNGDIVKEISQACEKYGVKFGIYLSPWDRNHPDYGKDTYVIYFRNQLKELLSRYGDIFEVWFDGANGGEGYYGGAREERKIDRSSYYRWDEIYQIIRELQPGAAIFGDAGPDIRWVGNEAGVANDTCWATYTPEPKDGETTACSGTTKYWLAEKGTQGGRCWMPAESDVSIRPGWFYHDAEDEKVKPADSLLAIYFRTVGNGAALNLNVPPDGTGRIHPIDSTILQVFESRLRTAFDHNLFSKAQATSDQSRGERFQASNVLDNDNDSYWATEDAVHHGAIEIRMSHPEWINCVVLQEYIPIGQRIDDFSVEVFQDDRWIEVAHHTTIGYKKIIRFNAVTTRGVRVNVIHAMACPAIHSISGYYLEF